MIKNVYLFIYSVLYTYQSLFIY